MKVFEIYVKFEEKSKWSDREFDAKGYFVQKNEEDDLVQGYLTLMYPIEHEKVRYITGSYSNESFVFLQLCNITFSSPICYCFPSVNKEGYWSYFNWHNGFFSTFNTFMGCSNGHAKVVINEITNKDAEKIAEKALKIFEENSIDATKINVELLKKVKFLKVFLNPSYILNMEMNCGKQ